MALPLRPKNHACHGATDEMQGTLAASQMSHTGLVMSGVPSTSIRSIWWLLIRFCATVPATLELDCASCAKICSGCVLPPTLMPLANSFCICAIVNVSHCPKSASGPVRGVT